MSMFAKILNLFGLLPKNITVSTGIPAPCQGGDSRQRYESTSWGCPHCHRAVSQGRESRKKNTARSD